MKVVRKIISLLLIPFSLIYGTVAQLRRYLFDWGIFKRQKAAIPTLVVGNIEVGGTGKTPMVQFLATYLSGKLNVAVLSRGYGRKTKGFLEVLENSNAYDVGDEPLLIKKNLPGILVFVGEKRIAAIEQIKKKHPEIQLVIMDDGFQHLPLKGDVYLLLNSFEKPIHKGFPFPSGTQREFNHNLKYADCMAVTKINSGFSNNDKLAFENHYNFPGTNIFYFEYNTLLPEAIEPGKPCIVVSGLAGNHSFTAGLKTRFNLNIVATFHYPDHYNYANSDVETWNKTLKQYPDCVMITTQKDMVKINQLDYRYQNRVLTAYPQPEIKFVDREQFFYVLLKPLNLGL